MSLNRCTPSHRAWSFHCSILCALFLFLPISLRAQGVVTGSETVISFTGNNIPIVPANTPASTLVSGTNTFIIPLANPTVSLRFYVTNNTANACTSLTAQVWADSDPSVNTFNNSLANWQVIPLQSPSGTLVQALGLGLPASGISYFETTAIAAPKIALQLTNILGQCSTTNLQVTATIFQVAVTSPLISVNSPTGFATGAGNVQGVIPQQQNGVNVFPVISGGLQAPSNLGFNTQGLDTFSSNGDGSAFLNFSGTLAVGTAPAPSTPGELGIAFEISTGDSVGGSFNAPWVCPLAQAGNCLSGGDISFFTVQNVTANLPFKRTYQNANSLQEEMIIIATLAGTTTTARQQRVIISSCREFAF